MNEEHATIDFRPGEPPTEKLAAALSKAQGDFPPIERTRTVKVRMKTGGTYVFDYAPLETIIAAVTPALAKNELCYRWIPHVEYKRDSEGNPYALVTQTCRLQHASGQYVECTIPLLTNEIGPQQIGSTLTYGRRYTFENIIGVASQQDDDGNAGSGNESESYDEGGPAMPACPKCGKTSSVIESKPEYGGGYFCFPKKGGCSTKFGQKEEPAADEHHEPAKGSSKPKSQGRKPKADAPAAEHHGPAPETEETIAADAAAAKATLDAAGLASLTAYLGMIAHAKRFEELTELSAGLLATTVETADGPQEKPAEAIARDKSLYAALRPALRAAGRYIQSEQKKAEAGRA